MKMPATDFKIEMDIDDNGILIVRISGKFDFNAWVAQRTALIETKFVGIDLSGRPSIADITECEPPDSDWAEIFTKIAQARRPEQDARSPRALVTGGKMAHTLSLPLYGAIEKARTGIQRDLNIFENFDDAYAWVLHMMPEAKKTKD